MQSMLCPDCTDLATLSSYYYRYILFFIVAIIIIIIIIMIVFLYCCVSVSRLAVFALLSGRVDSICWR